jgi:thiopeptide-type bacteriocin biosynthesis protein
MVDMLVPSRNKRASGDTKLPVSGTSDSDDDDLMMSDNMAKPQPALPGLDEATLADLIRMWRKRLGHINEGYSADDRATIDSYLEVFVRGGRAAVEALIRRGQWIQVSLSMPTSEASARQLHARIKQFVGALFSDTLIENFFFLFKPPGLRLRFEATGAVCRLTDLIRSETSKWKADGLVGAELWGIYEPETTLFGGPRSMKHVHPLFTLDSLVWLEYHSGFETCRNASVHPWYVSFTILRSLFDGLGIIGWEDLGVWEHIITRTGRELPADVSNWPEYPSVKSAVLTAWDGAMDCFSQVRPQLTQDSIFATCDDSIRAAAGRWKASYFDSPDAWIGPREAAAYFTIFHWNRGRFSAPQQALIAESLGRRCPS